MGKFIDETGKIYGLLTVINRAENRKGRPVFNCLCECGVRKEIRANELREGQKSCGCRPGNMSHGLSKTREHAIWLDMRQRCHNPNLKNYLNYGGRGIKVCERWINSFENFIADMGLRPGPEYSIDRKDNSLGYSPENCRWATPKEQANNTRRNRLVNYKGKTLTIAQWAEEFGIESPILYWRIAVSKWPIERALLTPTQNPRRKKA